jgi:hypothetical protein
MSLGESQGFFIGSIASLLADANQQKGRSK